MTIENESELEFASVTIENESELEFASVTIENESELEFTSVTIENESESELEDLMLYSTVLFLFDDDDEKPNPKNDDLGFEYM